MRSYLLFTCMAAPLLVVAVLSSLTAFPACASPRAPTAVRPLPADPGERLQRLEHLRRQILAKSRDVSDERWQRQVRAGVRRQLELMGFARAEVDRLLDDVDASRGQPSATAP
jgi:hypothetical protein